MLKLLVYLGQRNVKKFKNLTKTVNIDEESIDIFRTTSKVLMKFLGKMCHMIILKVMLDEN